MNFKEFRLLSEAKKELYAEIGKAHADALLKTRVDPEINRMHDSAFGKGNHHIEMPIENDVPDKVKAHIEANGDHLEGENVKLKSGRAAPISKYLSKSNAPKDVQDEHQNWAKNKVGNSKLVITRHPAEVASASTGTHWQSCAQATKKNSSEERPAWDAMPSELKHGTLMAMHVHKDAKPGKDGTYASKDVLGRALIKRHDADIDSPNPSEISFHREAKKYGAFPETAKKAVDDFAAKHYPQKNLTAHKEHTLYDDDNSAIKIKNDHPDILHAFDPEHHLEASRASQMAMVTRFAPAVAPQHILDLAASSIYNSVRNKVAIHSTNPETIRKVFKNPKNSHSGSAIHPTVNAVRNPHAPKDVLDAAVTHDNPEVRAHALKHPNATAANITTGLKDRSSRVQADAAANPNTTKDHINYVFDHANKTHADGKPVAMLSALNQAVKSAHASTEQIKSHLHHSYEEIATSTVTNPNITKEHLLHALDSPHKAVAKAALKHSLVDHDVLAKAAMHTSPTVHEAALTHPKMTPALFALAKKHPDPKMAASVKNYEADHHSSQKE